MCIGVLTLSKSHWNFQATMTAQQSMDAISSVYELLPVGLGARRLPPLAINWDSLRHTLYLSGETHVVSEYRMMAGPAVSKVVWQALPDVTNGLREAMTTPGLACHSGLCGWLVLVNLIESFITMALDLELTTEILPTKDISNMFSFKNIREQMDKLLMDSYEGMAVSDNQCFGTYFSVNATKQGYAYELLECTLTQLQYAVANPEVHRSGLTIPSGYSSRFEREMQNRGQFEGVNRTLQKLLEVDCNWMSPMMLVPIIQVWTRKYMQAVECVRN
jgi:hypothetical protein